MPHDRAGGARLGTRIKKLKHKMRKIIRATTREARSRYYYSTDHFPVDFG
jgi:hypothetical protein